VTLSLTHARHLAKNRPVTEILRTPLIIETKCKVIGCCDIVKDDKQLLILSHNHRQKMTTFSRKHLFVDKNQTSDKVKLVLDQDPGDFLNVNSSFCTQIQYLHGKIFIEILSVACT